MTAVELVRLVLVVLTTSLIGGIVLLFGHGVMADVGRRRRQARLARGRALLYQLLGPTASTDVDWSSGGSIRTALRVTAQLTARDQEEMIVPLARNLKPSTCQVLRRVAEEIGLLRHARALCHSRWWWKRLRGASILHALSSPSEVMLLLLEDPHPAIRAQAAGWSARHPSPEVVARLLGMIDDPAELSRFAVQDSLLRLGHVVVEPLAVFLEHRDGVEVEPALRVARTIPHPRFLAAAVRHSASADSAVRAHAVNLLGSIGGHDVSQILVQHLDDESAGVRVAAVRALGRMRLWPRAPEMAARLRDRSWDVRRAAGLAIRELGSPGTLMLRRMLDDHNRFAADMARQVLDLPAGVGELSA